MYYFIFFFFHWITIGLPCSNYRQTNVQAHCRFVNKIMLLFFRYGTLKTSQKLENPRSFQPRYWSNLRHHKSSITEHRTKSFTPTFDRSLSANIPLECTEEITQSKAQAEAWADINEETIMLCLLWVSCLKVILGPLSLCCLSACHNYVPKRRSRTNF